MSRSRGLSWQWWFIMICPWVLLPGAIYGIVSLLQGRPAPQTVRRSFIPDHGVIPEPAVGPDADVAALLRLGEAADDGLCGFRTRLETIADKRRWRPRLNVLTTRMELGIWNSAHAVAIRRPEGDHVVVLIGATAPFIPGVDTHTAILLNNRGQLLDDLSCEISNRLTAMNAGRFRAVIPEAPPPDRAQVVIRLDGVSVRGNFSHDLFHGDVGARYYWGHDRLPLDEPTTWDTRGLCRIAIRDGRFQVLFPHESVAVERPEPRRGLIHFHRFP